jgi:hypothetical protein
LRANLRGYPHVHPQILLRKDPDPGKCTFIERLELTFKYIEKKSSKDEKSP